MLASKSANPFQTLRSVNTTSRPEGTIAIAPVFFTTARKVDSEESRTAVYTRDALEENGVEMGMGDGMGGRQ